MVTILLAAVRKTAAARAERAGAERAGAERAGAERESASGTSEPAVSTAPIWLGVLGAVTLSGAFAAVLTFSVSVLTSAGQ